MDVEKTLCGSGRLEPLHLALSSPHTLGRCGAKVDLSVVVQFSSSGMATAPIAQAQRSLRPASRNGRLRSGSRSRWPGRSAGCRPVPSNRARQKARQPASPRPRTRSSNPVPSSGESTANLPPQWRGRISTGMPARAVLGQGHQSRLLERQGRPRVSKAAHYSCGRRCAAFASFEALTGLF